ncbi:MAG: lamin tail domain-containing protein, partial [Blastocatellia bacterium]
MCNFSASPGLGKSASVFSRSALIALFSTCFAIALVYWLVSPQPAHGVISPDIVISQVYGGGGNSGAPFQNDFIELFNRGATTIDITGWAIQYASSTGTSWQKTDLSGMLAPGKYYLIQQSSGGATGAPLPTPDATGTIAMAATAGKVALTNNNTLIVSGT